MLADDLKTLLATQYALSIKAQYFHWNVEGPDFAQYHDYFANFYEEVYSAVDRIAEYIRTLQEYSPGSFERFQELSIIQGQTKVPRARLMFEELLADNNTVIDLLNQIFVSAEQENKQGIANFVAERLDAQAKHGWMLRSFLKEERA
jgi:starvation-inducible DNA-binding protein